MKFSFYVLFGICISLSYANGLSYKFNSELN